MSRQENSILINEHTLSDEPVYLSNWEEIICWIYILNQMRSLVDLIRYSALCTEPKRIVLASQLDKCETKKLFFSALQITGGHRKM